MVKIFISYAHEDKEFKDELEKHFSVMRRNGEIEPWNDKMIMPGELWDETINTSLDNAQLLIFLISPDFLSSEYCYNIETSKAFKRHDEKSAKIVPIILRYCDWMSTPFAKFQVLPNLGKPVKDFADRDKAFLEVLEGIKKSIRALNEIEKGHTARHAQKSAGHSGEVQPPPPVSHEKKEILAPYIGNIHPENNTKKPVVSRKLIIGGICAVALVIILFFAFLGNGDQVDETEQEDPVANEQVHAIPSEGQPEFIVAAINDPATEDDESKRAKADKFNEKNNYDSSARYYIKYADFLDNSQQYFLALAFENGGKQFQKDTKEAFYWYTCSAENGDKDAMNIVAAAYDGGSEAYGVEVDYPAALAWYREAAGKGDVAAMDAIADMFQNARGVTFDIDSVKEWKRKSKETEKLNEG